MLFGIYLRTPKFWHTYVITYGDFMVILIVETCKCDQVSNLWQQLVLASELESDLRYTVDWSRKWFVDFNAAKIQLVLFDQSNNTDAIDTIQRWMGLFLSKNHLLRWWADFLF